MDENNNPFTGPMLPLTLIAAAAIFFLLSQLGSINQGNQSMTWQNDRADKLIKKLEDSQKNLAATIETNKQLVATSKQTQQQFTDLVKELDELARGGDEDAKFLIQGYGIKVSEPPAAPAPSTEGAAKPEEKPAEKKPE